MPGILVFEVQADRTISGSPEGGARARGSPERALSFQGLGEEKEFQSLGS